MRCVALCVAICGTPTSMLHSLGSVWVCALMESDWNHTADDVSDTRTSASSTWFHGAPCSVQHTVKNENSKDNTFTVKWQFITCLLGSHNRECRIDHLWHIITLAWSCLGTRHARCRDVKGIFQKLKAHERWLEKREHTVFMSVDFQAAMLPSVFKFHKDVIHAWSYVLYSNSRVEK